MESYTISAVTTTRRAPQQIWAVLDDFSGWPRWMPALKGVRIEPLAAGPLASGYRFRVRGAIVSADLLVTACSELERATSFRLSWPPLTGANRCLLTPLVGGGYRVERTDRLDLPGPLVAWLQATQRTRFEQLASDFLAALMREAGERV